MSDRFKLYSGMLRAYEAEGTDGVKRKRFRTTASSSIKDLAGDEIEYPAIEKMATQARNNLTIFLNHSYNVPEDVLGSVEDAQVMKRGLDENGADIVDLDLDIGLNESNPRAVQAWDSIKSGVKLGTSIGAIVRHATKKKGGGLLIDDLDLLEASLVGIPANPRSWVQYAVKSLGAVEDPLIDEEVDDDFEITEAGVAEDLETKSHPELPDSAFACEEKRKYPHHTKSGAVDKALLRAALSRIGDKSNDQCGKGHLLAHAKAEGIGDHDKASGIFTLALDDEEMGEKLALTLSAEDLIDYEAARTRITVTVDSEPAQEAPKSEPGNATASLLDETAEGDDAVLGDNVTRDLPPVEVPDPGLTTKLISLTGQVMDMRKAVEAVTKERDEALANLDLAKQLISRMERLPLRRKTAPILDGSQTQKDYSKFSGIYDPEVIKLLEK